MSSPGVWNTERSARSTLSASMKFMKKIAR
jgi:transposase